jgi:NAD+ synthase
MEKYQNFEKEIVKGLKDFTDIAIVGMSGGADSTLVTTLCVQALGKENVVGIHMPCGATDEKTFNSRSRKTADRLGVKSYFLPIKETVDALIREVLYYEDLYISDLVAGNTRSRMRMVNLYAMAGIFSQMNPGKRVRVIGTGNLSEDFIGYDTKGGDALADIFPIGELYKSEVYGFLDYYKEKGVLDEENIDRVPSAGLWEGQTDEGELGYSYNQMQTAVEYCMNNYEDMESEEMKKEMEEDPLLKFVWNRHVVNKHKHMAPKVITLKEWW